MTRAIELAGAMVKTVLDTVLYARARWKEHARRKPIAQLDPENASMRPLIQMLGMYERDKLLRMLESLKVQVDRPEKMSNDDLRHVLVHKLRETAV